MIQSLQWLGGESGADVYCRAEGKRKARRVGSFNGSEVLECRENRLHMI